MATVPPPVGPFLHTERIVNPDGTPTEYFLRQQLSQSGVNASGDATINAVTALENRNIATGTGLVGGGDLTADRTLALSDTAVTPDTYGDATNVPQITVDQQGRITAAANVAIAGGGSFRGALVTRNTNSSANTTWPKIFLPNTSVYDTDSIWNSGVNPTRLTVPNGVSRIRLQYYVILTASTFTGSIVLAMRQNGTTDDYPGAATTNVKISQNVGFLRNSYFGTTAVIPAVAGDYYEVRVNTSNFGGGASYNGGFLTNSSMSMEIIA